VVGRMIALNTVELFSPVAFRLTDVPSTI